MPPITHYLNAFFELLDSRRKQRGRGRLLSNMALAFYRRCQVGLFCACGLVLFGTACSDGSNSSLDALPITAYLQKPGDFLGNRYLLRAQINEQLKWEKGLGRVLAVVVEGNDARLPVFVPESIGENLYVGQRYAMEAIIEEGGLIYVEALRKY